LLLSRPEEAPCAAVTPWTAARWCATRFAATACA